MRLNEYCISIHFLAKAQYYEIWRCRVLKFTVDKQGRILERESRILTYSYLAYCYRLVQLLFTVMEERFFYDCKCWLPFWNLLFILFVSNMLNK